MPPYQADTNAKPTPPDNPPKKGFSRQAKKG